MVTNLIDDKYIWEAWKFLREKNSSIPDETIDFIRDAALKELYRLKFKKCPNCDFDTHIVDNEIDGHYIACNKCDWYQKL